MQFRGVQARAIGRGFAGYVERSGLVVWACAILPDHVHLVIGKPITSIEKVVIQLKGAATKALREEELHPFADGNKCFSRGEWKVFLDADDVRRAICYVERNPSKEGKPVQRRRFVTPRP